MRLGLVSVTFRHLHPNEIADLVVQAGLETIEWGGDIHVPHGDFKQAETVRQLTAARGLAVAAYGSYYRAGQGEPFRSVLDTAVALGAPTIRIWAGIKGSSKTDSAERAAIVKDIRECCESAVRAGLTLSLEYHRGTLTDELESCLRLAEEVGHSGLRLYWQPDTLVSHEQRLGGLKLVMPFLTNVHAFHWTRLHGENVRHALDQGEGEWQDYLGVLRQAGFAGDLLIEFVKGDAPNQFMNDARTLRAWRESIMGS